MDRAVSIYNEPGCDSTPRAPAWAEHATESAAMWAVCLRRKLTAEESHRPGKQLLDRIVGMRIKLCPALQGDGRHPRVRVRVPALSSCCAQTAAE
jgi:hypothetical protein